MFCLPENKNIVHMYTRVIHDDYKKVDKFSNESLIQQFLLKKK